MTSTFSPNLKLELITTGEQSGSWGTTTNVNLGTLIEEAISGYATQAVTDGASTVLTIPDGTSSVGRNYVIQLTGALTAARTVEVPAVEKPYTFYNATTGGFAVTVKVAGQTGVVIANGKKAIVYNNGTDVIEVANAPVTEAGTQTLTNKTLTSPTVNGGSLVGVTASIVARVSNVASASSVTVDPSTYDMYVYTALAAALTFNASTTGSPTNGTKMTFRIKDNGTARALNWTISGTGSYRGVGLTLPSTTVASKVMYIGCIYNADEFFWDVVALSTQS
jgi:hypothetical protein